MTLECDTVACVGIAAASGALCSKSESSDELDEDKVSGGGAVGGTGGSGFGCN